VRLFNTGNLPTGELTLTLTGVGAGEFTLSTTAPGSLEAGGEADIAFTVQAGLAPGVYTATLTATAEGMTPVSTAITYTVTPTGTEVVTATALHAYAADGGLQVSGLIPGELLTIYTMQGQLVYKGKAIANEQHVPLYGRGVYIVVNGNRTVKCFAN
jgi:hypothetical protein